jgi:hypothetical protein
LRPRLPPGKETIHVKTEAHAGWSSGAAGTYTDTPILLLEKREKRKKKKNKEIFTNLAPIW